MMRAQDSLRVAGRVTWYLVEGDLDDAGIRAVLAGEHPAIQVVRANLVTNVGRRQMVKRLTDQASTPVPSHIAFGSTVITPAVTDTAPTGETFRKACSTIAPHQDYFARFVMNALTSEANGTIRGAFLLDAASGGNLWALVSANVEKANTQSLVTEWLIEVRA